MEDIVKFWWLFGVVSCLKILFFDFHEENLSSNADMYTPYCTKSPLLTRPTELCKKNLEMIENTFFIYLHKKKPLTKKKFKCVQWAASKHH